MKEQNENRTFYKQQGQGTVGKLECTHRLIHGVDGFLGGLLVAERDETKASAAAGLAIVDDVGVGDASEVGEGLQTQNQRGSLRTYHADKAES